MSGDRLSGLKTKFHVEESRLTVRHGSKLRAGLWTVRCRRCPTMWTLQIKENGETSPPIEGLLGHYDRHDSSEPKPVTTGNGTPTARWSSSSCPRCSGETPALILYGLFEPSPEPDAKLRAKTITLGGCMIEDDSPKWHCNRCSYEWGRVRS